jgi:hypothetical protein
VIKPEMVMPSVGLTDGFLLIENYCIFELVKKQTNLEMLKYKRILLKLSGESLMGQQQYGIDQNRLNDYAEEIASLVKAGVQIGIVIGGGNIFRAIKWRRKRF